MKRKIPHFCGNCGATGSSIFLLNNTMFCEECQHTKDLNQPNANWI